MDANFERAQLLIQQSRFELAEQELRIELSNNPENFFAHSLLAISLLEQNREAEALNEAQFAIGMMPGFSYGYYVLGRIFFVMDRYKESEENIKQAIEIDPGDAAYYSFLAHIYGQKKKWQATVDTANEGLVLDPENISCINAKAMALQQLGRKAEASESINTALFHDPNNPFTHANKGWNLLQNGNEKQALFHFKEALRLHPNYDWAREGIIESLKARNRIYRLLLKYFFLMGKLSVKTKLFIIIGAIILLRVLLLISDSYPQMGGVIYPLLIVYFLFVFLTWTAKSMFNLELRLDPVGRLALSDRQITASNWVGFLLILAFTFLGIGLWLNYDIRFIVMAVSCCAIIIPVSVLFQVEKPKIIKTLSHYTLTLGATLTTSFVVSLFNEDVALNIFTLFVLGLVVYTWLANYLLSKD